MPRHLCCHFSTANCFRPEVQQLLSGFSCLLSAAAQWWAAGTSTQRPPTACLCHSPAMHLTHASAGSGHVAIGHERRCRVRSSRAASRPVSGGAAAPHQASARQLQRHYTDRQPQCRRYIHTVTAARWQPGRRLEQPRLEQPAAATWPQAQPR
jgi:hypothetical protein